MIVGKVEVLLVVSGLDVDRSAEAACPCISISRKVIWEEEMVQVNRTG